MPEEFEVCPRDTYYERKSIEMLDGTKTFQSPADRERENEVAIELGKYWSRPPKSECKLVHFAPLCPIDWYAERDYRLVALLELKSDLADKMHVNAWLSVKKWLALTMGSLGLGVPAIFVVKFKADGSIRWLPLNQIDATKHRIAGRNVVKSSSDIEPIIEVPVDSMKVVK